MNRSGVFLTGIRDESYMLSLDTVLTTKNKRKRRLTLAVDYELIAPDKNGAVSHSIYVHNVIPVKLGDGVVVVSAEAAYIKSLLWLEIGMLGSHYQLDHSRLSKGAIEFTLQLSDFDSEAIDTLKEFMEELKNPDS